jgi:hypothetical protein
MHENKGNSIVYGLLIFKIYFIFKFLNWWCHVLVDGGVLGY